MIDKIAAEDRIKDVEFLYEDWYECGNCDGEGEMYRTCCRCQGKNRVKCPYCKSECDICKDGTVVCLDCVGGIEEIECPVCEGKCGFFESDFGG